MIFPHRSVIRGMVRGSIKMEDVEKWMENFKIHDLFILRSIGRHANRLIFKNLLKSMGTMDKKTGVTGTLSADDILA